MRTTRESDGVLPERPDHGGVVFYGGGDEFGENGGATALGEIGGGD
jgi:hypothetical protein